MQNVTLYCREGSSDKVYQASIHPKDSGYMVHFAYGRRGSTLTAGTKTSAAVPEEEARQIFDKLVQEKMAKGYSPGANGSEHVHNGHSEHSGIFCQLLNPATDIEDLLNNQTHWMQEKFDGRRLLIKKEGTHMTGINRLGLAVAVPRSLESARTIKANFIIDGEMVGDSYHVFDLLAIDGKDIRSARFADRSFHLWRLLEIHRHAHIHRVHTYTSPEKNDRFQELKEQGKAGVVFKHIDAPYTAGRPKAGGSQVKHQFHETASFIVAKVHDKRSVSLILFDGEKVRPAGNVTVPPNHDMPAIGTVVKCRYVYAYQKSGFIYQPVFLGRREDVRAAECQTSQLKYKGDPVPV